MILADIIAAVLCAVGIGACDAPDGEHTYQGYVEGEYVLVAPVESGRIEEVSVRRGDVVEAGTPLFRLEYTDVEADHREAEARLAEAQAELADLKVGKRDEEIEVILAEITEAEATLREAEVEYERQRKLASRQFASESAHDAARAAHERAVARLDAAQRELVVARLPARENEIAAARRNVEAAQADLAHAEWRLSQRWVNAPSSGLVEDTLRRIGEMASPSAPVVSLLPPANRKVRFFVPEPERVLVALGDRVAVGCDGCNPGLEAEVIFISSEAEYTPPVIFSVESRQKLVYMVEARPLADAERLHPGQPVDVTVKAAVP